MATRATSTRKSSAAPTAVKKTSSIGKPPALKLRKSESVTKAKATPAVASKADKTGNKKQKPSDKKLKTIRDSFNMPANDYALIGAMKKRAIASGREIKKSELLRAGLKALAAMTEAAFAMAIGAVPAIKTGRPQKKRK